MDADAASLRTDMLSMLLGSTSPKEETTPSIRISGSLFPSVPNPRMRICASDPGTPLNWETVTPGSAP